MKDCKRCGKTLDDNVRFCPDCGLDQEEPPAELKPQSNKKIGVLSIIMWVFCGIFVILALGQITRFNFPATLLFLALAFLLCPMASDILYKCTGKSIPKSVQGVLIAVVFLVVPYIRGVMIKSQNQTVAVPELTETAANTEITTEFTTTEATTAAETTTEATTTTTTTEPEETTTEASSAAEEETTAAGTKHSIDINDVKPEITSVPHGELLSVIENEINGRSVLVVKTKIKSGISNRATITQNFFNVENIVVNQYGYTYDEIQYWAVADMADGSESKVVSFTIDKTVIDLLYNRKIPANMLDDYASDVYILPSLLQ